ncbi:lipid-A-disaccharide synthase [Anaerosinus massiliensis]|uniref:lipid-A-disaccharide synthase n=1 Tax=Massilibacillus massiliensis TaxID=1806837 RepID=UPI000A9BE4A7|nr:lipid-A-disaccharide synthase [Massilibacillus massiliensis]
MCKVMISVGEASGDLHGASIAAELKKIKPDIKLFGMGGKAMRAAGVEITHDFADLNVMGFFEVIKNLPRFFKLRDELVEVMKKEKPDVLLIIDYPDFNIRLAKCAKKLGVPILSYIPPSAWAWRKGRAKSVAKIVDKIASIFPFEAEVYKKAGAEVVFVGHPLVDIVKPSMTKEEAYQHFSADPACPVVLLLPGSRAQEITSLLPVMLEGAEKIQEDHPNCQFFLPVASTISQEMLQNMMKDYKVNVSFVHENIYDLMNIANVGIAASGTVTLEAAILNLPVVVVYKMPSITYFIGKLLVKIPNISLPNIVANERIIPELLQDEVTAEHIACEAITLLEENEKSEMVHQNLLKMKKTLGEQGAVRRVAEEVLSMIDEK